MLNHVVYWEGWIFSCYKSDISGAMLIYAIWGQGLLVFYAGDSCYCFK